MIVDRSADLSATCLTGVFEKAGIFETVREDERNPNERDRFSVSEEYRAKEGEWITVGVDGSVYKHVPGYAARLKSTISRIVGVEIGARVKLVHAEDGSGKGAALAVASQFHARAHPAASEE